jgi:sulfur carrier protein ThiS
MSNSQTAAEFGGLFLELRNKVHDSDLLSASVEKILKALGFTGKITIVLQNGHILKSGYEEGYFRRKDD